MCPKVISKVSKSNGFGAHPHRTSQEGKASTPYGGKKTPAAHPLTHSKERKKKEKNTTRLEESQESNEVHFITHFKLTKLDTLILQKTNNTRRMHAGHFFAFEFEFGWAQQVMDQRCPLQRHRRRRRRCRRCLHRLPRLLRLWRLCHGPWAFSLSNCLRCHCPCSSEVPARRATQA